MPYYVTCFECGETHVAEYSHISEVTGRPVYAVVCERDNLTDYYTDEIVRTERNPS
jgi:hypothetical protein